MIWAVGIGRRSPGARAGCIRATALNFADDFTAEVMGEGAGRRGHDALRPRRRGVFCRPRRHGAMPLPPYIKRPRGGDPADRGAYQTMFAREPGAVAAPTAGLHFTPALVERREARGIELATHDPSCRAGDLPAGQDRRPARAQDARRVGRHYRRDRRAHPRREGARRADHRDRHDEPAPPRKRRGGDRRNHAVRRRDAAFYPARLSLQGGRPAADQFPFAALDAFHAGQRTCRAGAHEGGVRACGRGPLSVLLLRRCLFDRAAPPSRPSPACGGRSASERWRLPTPSPASGGGSGWGRCSIRVLAR